MINKQITFMNENHDIKDKNKFNIEAWAPEEPRTSDPETMKKDKK